MFYLLKNVGQTSGLCEIFTDGSASWLATVDWKSTTWQPETVGSNPEEPGAFNPTRTRNPTVTLREKGSFLPSPKGDWLLRA